MLRLKPTFYLYTDEISEQIKKIIKSKYIEQIAQYVLNDIAKNPRQAGLDNTIYKEEDRKVW